MSPETERSRGLVDFVREEVRAFQSGEIDRISTAEELRRTFRYSDKSSVYRPLRRWGLVEERRNIRNETGEAMLFTPSRELAWFLGVLSGGGYVGDDGKIILSRTYNKDLVSAFQATGEHLFRTDAKHSTVQWPSKKQSLRIEFSNIKAARALGSLRRTQWPQTIIEKHGWILDDPKYLWSFLAGILDTRGGISMSNARIRIYTIYPNVANFLTNLLVHAGIENPRMARSRRTRTGIIGVIINGLRDANIFACNVHSKIPEKDKLLEFYRQMEPPRAPVEASSREKLLQEWLRLRKTLGHPPSFREIEILQKQGETKFGPATYANRFGRTTQNRSGRSFIKAREELERISREQTTSRESGLSSSTR